MQTTRCRGGIFCAIILVLFLSFSTLSYSQKKKYSSFLPENNSSLRYQAGLPNFEMENPLQEAARKFGFSFYRVSGCTVDPEFWKYCEKQNKKLDRKITKRSGPDWEQTFDQETTRLYQLFRFADTLLMQDSSFWHQQAEVMVKYAGSKYSREIGKDSAIISTLTGNDPPLTYFRETGKDSVLFVMICSTNKWVIDSQLLLFKQFEFNLITKELLPIAISPGDTIITSGKK